MPESMQQGLQQTWKQIAEVIPGTEFNFAFWTDNAPRRSTWPSCRAVIAARRQSRDFERPMIKAIQRAYYLQKIHRIATPCGSARKILGVTAPYSPVPLKAKMSTMNSLMNFARCKDSVCEDFQVLSCKRPTAAHFQYPLSISTQTASLNGSTI